jgi:hypothetical protein
MVRQGKIEDWDALAREVRLIWDNAKEYNDPSSAIYEMTESLEASKHSTLISESYTDFHCRRGLKIKFRPLVLDPEPRHHGFLLANLRGPS